MSKTNLLIGGVVILVVGFFVGSYYVKNANITKNSANSKNITSSKMTVKADGLAIWQFPDKKALDPKIFGTPQNPLNIDLLPLAMRDVNNNGTAYTTTKKPVPFSNKFKKTSGSITISVEDLTAKDSKKSKDTAKMEANFKGPNGENFKVVLNKLIPVGPTHPFFGGVGTNVLMHGATGIGTPLVAEEFSYITLWGVGTLYKNGKLVDRGRIIHMMVSEKTRGDDFSLGLGVAKPDELEIHLIMPPQKGSPTGPIDSPLPTGVKLPNGVEQPFIHVNFYGNITTTGNRFIK